MTILESALKKYLAFSCLQKDVQKENELLRKELLKRGLKKHYLKSLKAAEENLHCNSTNEYIVPFTIQQEKLGQLLLARKEKNTIEKIPEQSDRMLRSLIIILVSEMMGLIDGLTKSFKGSGRRFTTSLLEKIQNEINITRLIAILKESGNENEIIHLELYLDLLYLLQINTSEFFSRYRNNLFNNHEKLTTDQRNNLFGRLVDYCIVQRREGKSGFSRELLNVYKKLLSSNAYLHSQQPFFPEQLFRNIITAGVRENELEWTKQFIMDYSPMLDPAIQNDYYNYHLARLYGRTGELYKALSHLSEVHSNPPEQISIDVRMLYVKLYYELDMSDLLESTIDSFRHFLKNNRSIAAQRRQPLVRFLNITSRLYKEKTRRWKSRIEMLSFEINKPPAVLKKYWLNECLEKLKDVKSR